MLNVPLVAVPSQVLAVSLATQSCQINVYTKAPGLFLDLYVNNTLIIGGVLCLNATPIVRDAYLGFIGDLCFFDLAGNADPVYTDLGTRFILAYVPTDQLWPPT